MLIKAIGWRQQSLRMLLYMSNANFHLAGDGKVRTVVYILNFNVCGESVLYG